MYKNIFIMSDYGLVPINKINRSYHYKQELGQQLTM